ncbi:MAG TPA: hypothetical protein P5513_04425 [Candidatus Diapherotrites archaeon]|nr:hypothetical protein [Candidatus Diapherotrites archaeon]
MKIYRKYGPFNEINNPSVANFLEKNKDHRRLEERLEVFIENDNYENPKVVLEEYIYDTIEPWKSGWCRVAETIWNGEFVPDETWEIKEVSN